MAKLNKKRCTVITGAILIAAGGALPAAQNAADKSRLMPDKDEEINALLVKIRPNKDSKETQAELRKIERGRLCRGLAYGLMRYETRYGALRFVNAHGPFKELTPYVVLALKWGRGRERLEGLSIVVKTRAKAAIPVLVSHVLDDDYMIRAGGGGGSDLNGHGRFAMHAPTYLFAKTSRTLHILSDAKMGYPSLGDGVRGARRKPMKRKWRTWWQQNAAKHFPDLKSDETSLDSEQRVKKWCEDTTTFWPKEMTAEAQQEIDKYYKTRSRLAKNTRQGLYRLSPPSPLSGPIHTALLIRRLLATPPGAAEADSDAFRIHRMSLVCLSGSRNFTEVTSFFTWAIANGKIKDRAAVAHALGRLPNSRSVALLAKMVGEDPDTPDLLYELALSLGMLAKAGFAGTADPLAAMLAVKDPPKALFRHVRSGLGDAGRSDPVEARKAVKAVAPFLHDPREEVVIVAVEVLGGVGREDALKLLQDLLPKLSEKAKPRAEEMILWIERRLGKKRSPEPIRP